ncbi:unnamed protein product [Chrysoparadoxa australica]
MVYPHPSNRCAQAGCTKQPSFGYPNQRARTHCAVHKLEGMEAKFKQATCAHEGCNKQPSFGYANQRSKTHCAEHKTEGMEPKFKQATCAEPGCTKGPSFGYPHQRGRTHCAAHKEEGMEPKGKQAKCALEGCVKVPYFGYPGQRARTHCAAHKLDGMECKVKQTTCAFEGCNKQPSFGYINQRSKTHCATHKLEGMDRKFKRAACDVEGCSKVPCCGLPSTKPTRCAQHQVEGMFNWSSPCSEPGCTRKRRYGAAAGAAPTVCADHKKPGTPRDFRGQQAVRRIHVQVPVQLPAPHSATPAVGSEMKMVMLHDMAAKLEGIQMPTVSPSSDQSDINEEERAILLAHWQQQPPHPAPHSGTAMLPPGMVSPPLTHCRRSPLTATPHSGNGSNASGAAEGSAYNWAQASQASPVPRYTPSPHQRFYTPTQQLSSQSPRCTPTTPQQQQQQQYRRAMPGEQLQPRLTPDKAGKQGADKAKPPAPVVPVAPPCPVIPTAAAVSKVTKGAAQQAPASGGWPEQQQKTVVRRLRSPNIGAAKGEEEGEGEGDSGCSDNNRAEQEEAVKEVEGGAEREGDKETQRKRMVGSFTGKRLREAARVGRARARLCVEALSSV